MSESYSRHTLSTAEYEYDANGQRVRVRPAHTPQRSGGYGENVPRTERAQAPPSAPAPTRDGRRLSVISRGSGAQGPPLILRHGSSGQPQSSFGSFSPSSPPEITNYTYKSNASTRDESSLPHRHIDYETPNNFSSSGPLPPAPQTAGPRSRLSTLAREFASIHVNDYAGCETFIEQHDEILDEDEEDFLKEALAAMTAGKEDYAMCCVQQYLLLRDCGDISSSKDRRKYFTLLIKKEKQAMLRFLTNRDREINRLRLKVQDGSRRSTAQRQDLTGSLEALSFDEPSPRHSSGHLGAPFPTPPQQNLTSNNASVRAGAANRRLTVSGASDAPTFYGPGGVPEALDDRYHPRNNPAGFFTFGRVFAMLWHSTPGINVKNDPKRGDQVKTGRFGEPILSHIQRMAIVKEDRGFCWCIPINTYNGQGVAKNGFKDRDVRAHAIIYMTGTPSEGAAGEPKMSKKPIEVNPAATDQKLAPMSRIHFGKVHTVEHNVKVMDVGQISKNSLQQFEAYWDLTTQEANRHADRRR